MLVVTDTHVHIYPCYDLAAFFRYAFWNLARLGPERSVKVLMLTERFDCHFFKTPRVPDGYRLEKVDDGSLRITNPEGLSLYLIAGRQIVSQERIEILALTVDADIPDGLPAKEVLNLIYEAKGIPILSWAPGKWFFKRGEIIQDLTLSNPGILLLGDTSLRPTLWPKPCLMKYSGKKVAAGSDPLPFVGEENQVGRYGIVGDFAFDETKPTESVRRILSEEPNPWTPTGTRGGPIETVIRLYKNARSKKT